MANVVIYTSAFCGYCTAAKNILQRRGASFSEVRIDQTAGAREKMVEISGRRTVPQIFIDDHHVGGHDDLLALDRAGQLEAMLSGSPADEQ